MTECEHARRRAKATLRQGEYVPFIWTCPDCGAGGECSGDDIKNIMFSTVDRKKTMSIESDGPMSEAEKDTQRQAWAQVIVLKHDVERLTAENERLMAALSDISESGYPDEAKAIARVALHQQQTPKEPYPTCPDCGVRMDGLHKGDCSWWNTKAAQ